jgi:hypothetical protein
MIASRRVFLLVFGVLTTLAVGAASVHAAPACQRLVRGVRDKLVPNPVGPATLVRWNAWNKTHPNFHPKPRPKYKLTTEEVIQKMDFDCQVPVDTFDLAIEIPPQLPVPPPTDLFPPPTPPKVVVEPVTLPLRFTPLEVPSASPVPEPPSFVLALTGVTFLVTLAGMRRSKA